MRHHILFSIATAIAILMASQTAQAQHQPRAGLLASEFNQLIGPINDGIDNLSGKLNDSSLSMSDAASIVSQESALRQKADALWNSTQDGISDAFDQTRKDILQYNENNKDLDYKSALISTKIDVLNNVSKYPTKSEFEANKTQMSNAWENNYGSRLKPFGEEWDKQREQIFKDAKEKYGVDMKAEGYDRIGSINPYTGETYYKYYDKDGNALYAQWQDDANGWDKYRQDVNTYRRRQLEQQDALTREATDLPKFNNQFQNARQNTGARLSSLNDQVLKVNFAGNWNGYDNVGNWVRLYLNNNGSMNWSWGRTSTAYSSGGTWNQVGKAISMRTNDGQWTLRSTITAENRLEFIERNSSGATYTEYLNR